MPGGRPVFPEVPNDRRGGHGPRAGPAGRIGMPPWGPLTSWPWGQSALLVEASAISQLSFRILIASSTAAAKFFLIQAYLSVLSDPEGV